MERAKQLKHHHQQSPRFAWHCGLVLFSVLTISTTVQAFDYADALTKSLLYFESQWSRRLPYNQRVTLRDHSGLTDGLEQGVDLLRGYYDAGDHVKFGLPISFTITMLSWSIIEFCYQIVNARGGSLGRFWLSFFGNSYNRGHREECSLLTLVWELNGESIVCRELT